MSIKPRNTTTDSAVQMLRKKILSIEPEQFLGSEESMITELGASRSTVRQAARILEIEGLLRVKRGINGGYYGTRPNAKTIEDTVTSYLETIDIAYSEVTTISSLLWVEVVRRVASLPDASQRQLDDTLKQRVLKLKSDASFDDVLSIERACREAFFTLANSPYIETLFNINSEFASRRFVAPPRVLDGTDEHLEFLMGWRDARLMELTATVSGDVEVAVMAARHLRFLWHKRVWSSQRLANNDGE